jgi:hypothetical protein
VPDDLVESDDQKTGPKVTNTASDPPPLSLAANSQPASPSRRLRDPTVYFFSAKSLVCRSATVILFVIAGLLLYCASSALSLGAYRVFDPDKGEEKREGAKL